MRVIVTAMPWSPYLTYLRGRIPPLEVVMDSTLNAFDTFQASLSQQGIDPAIKLEDDALLTRNFLSKAEAVIANGPSVVMQFFSMRKADLVLGSRLDRKYSSNVGMYLPAGYALPLLDYSRAWRAMHPEHPTGYDLMMDDWLKSRSEPHWIVVPNLVDHRKGPSRIGPRSSERKSLTFQDPDL